ncbi:MAG: hypothetical protein ACRDPI_04965 [Nocardioidaceae bacterium]
MSYRDRWTGAACLAVALSLGVAMVLWSPVGVVFTVGLLWAGSAIGYAAWGRRPVRGWRPSFLTGAGAVAAWALVSASPPLALLALIVVAGTCPPFLRLFRAHRPASLAGMTDTELCRMWRSTFWELKERRPVDEALGLVALRQSCLEELERRNPSTLDARLASASHLPGDADAR